MTVIDPLDPQHAPKDIRAWLEQSPDFSLLGVLAQAQGTFTPWTDFSTALLTNLELSPLLRELAILQVAALQAPGGSYEWAQHAPLAVTAGVRKSQLRALWHGDLSRTRFSDEQIQVLRYTHQVVVDGRASAKLQATVLDLLGPRQVVELLQVIGHYMMVARITAAAGLGPETLAPIVAQLEGVAASDASRDREAA
jgi:4-carboxymuconolactone decarboxylase